MPDDRSRRLAASLTALADRIIFPKMGRRTAVARLRDALPRELAEALLQVQLERFVEQHQASKG